MSFFITFVYTTTTDTGAPQLPVAVTIFFSYFLLLILLLVSLLHLPVFLFLPYLFLFPHLLLFALLFRLILVLLSLFSSYSSIIFSYPSFSFLRYFLISSSFSLLSSSSLFFFILPSNTSYSPSPFCFSYSYFSFFSKLFSPSCPRSPALTTSSFSYSSFNYF